ncbi:MAG: 4'-phosphopantetheinyl transferase superfamily protein [Casimicrobiaceae bacterium]
MSVDDLSVAGNVVARALRSPAGGVHAWWCEFGWSDAAVESARALLGDDERSRASRFATQPLRACYITTRATLRMLLARWLDDTPDLVALAQTPRGRPYIDRPGAPDFNVSHTRDAAIIVIAATGRIGVDVERRDRRVDAAGLAPRYLARRECAAMQSCAAGASREYFLRLWTCKEAMGKATGDGLAAPMAQISVDLSADGAHLHAGPAPYTPADWALSVLDVPATHEATAALWRPLHG